MQSIREAASAVVGLPLPEAAWRRMILPGPPGGCYVAGDPPGPPPAARARCDTRPGSPPSPAGKWRPSRATNGE
eukprot:12937863-Prorocentrum_lima.AAC.1